MATTSTLRWFLAAGFTLLTLLALLQLYRGTLPAMSCFGLALAAGAPLIGILTHRGTRGRPPLSWTIISGLGLAVTMAMSYRYGHVAGHTHVWAGISLIAWYAWVRWLRGASAQA